ncbi:protein disulfide-isomerase A4 [Heptranchias perlo]|uniref:protein disulfide-isomerase A4 n=1 Tax=Heptranchias perlo TaxID=212740 RepID=UPI00355A4247
MELKKVSLLLLLLAQLAIAVLAQEKAESDGEGEDGEEEEDDDDDDDYDDESVKEENGVLVLTDANYDSFIADKDIVLIEFYAPWCEHCKRFAPEYEKIATELKEYDPPIPVAKVDATSQSGLGQQFDIGLYPTFKIVKNRQPIHYKGALEKDEILSKVKEVAAPDWIPPAEATITLTEEIFDDVVNNADIVLVEFYAPWCGHCKKLAPQYEEAAQELSKRPVPILLAKVDATVETKLANKYQVTGYPTLKVFRKGKPFEYNGPRETHGIIEYMIEQAGPPSKQIQALKQVQEFLKDGDDVIIVGLFNGEDDPAYHTYQDACNSVREDYRLHHTFSSEMQNFLKASPGQLVTMQPEKFQSPHESKMRTLTIKETTSQSDVMDFITNNAVPLVGHRKQSNEAKRYSKRPLVVVYYGVDFSFDYRVATQYWRKKVLEVAKDFPEYTFAIADEEDYSSELNDLGLADSGEEVNVAILDVAGKKYAMEPDEFDSNTLREFVLAFKKGKLKPIVKSQPIPKSNKGPVKVVVGKTFAEIVMDKKKDVLIEFYAPWCGHCKQMEPIYLELGKKYKNEENLIIAKMDATANDVPNDKYKTEGFPTIYFAPSNNKDNPIQYDQSERDLDSLSKFVEEHATKLSRSKDEL